jgi:hypothetical protein
MVKRMVKHCLALAVLCLLVLGCKGGDSPTAPTGSSTTATPNTSCAQSQGCPSIDSLGFWVRIQSNTNGSPGGPWSFTFLDKTFTGTGNAEYGFVQVAVSDYQISGTFSTSGFIVSIGRQSGGHGGVLPSSVQSLEGTLSSGPSNGCAVVYFTQAAVTTPQVFRIKFTTTASNGDIC